MGPTTEGEITDEGRKEKQGKKKKRMKLKGVRYKEKINLRHTKGGRNRPLHFWFAQYILQELCGRGVDRKEDVKHILTELQ